MALAHSSAVVLMNSNGGLLLPGLEIGKAIRLKGFTTVVPEGFQCASACALAWLAGTPRFMSPNGRVGFHAAYLEADGRRMPTSTGNALVGAYLNAAAMPRGLMGRQVSVKVGMGVQINSSGTEQGRMLSFREITVFPAGGPAQP